MGTVPRLIERGTTVLFSEIELCVAEIRLFIKKYEGRQVDLHQVEVDLEKLKPVIERMTLLLEILLNRPISEMVADVGGIPTT